jgi:ABC-type sugar transport system, ATPase component
MISSDLPELLGMADRIYVMKDGEICGEVSRNAPDFTQEKVLAIAIGESQIA